MMRETSSGNCGQALVETALIFPIVLLLGLGAVDFGRVYTEGITLSSAAHEAAAYAAQHQADGSSSGGSCHQAWGDTIDVALGAGSSAALTCANVSVSIAPADPYGRSPITVSIHRAFSGFTPGLTQALGLTHVGAHATARGESW